MTPGIRLRRLVHSCGPLRPLVPPVIAQVPLGQPVPVRAERFLHELKKKRQPQEVSPVPVRMWQG